MQIAMFITALMLLFFFTVPFFALADMSHPECMNKQEGVCISDNGVKVTSQWDDSK